MSDFALVGFAGNRVFVVGIEMRIFVFAGFAGEDVAFCDFDEVGKGHYGAAYDVVEFLMAFAHVAVLECDVVETDFFGYGLRYLYFLADAVDEMEAGLRVVYGERNAGETAAGAEVEERCALAERFEEAGNGEGVEYVVAVEVVDIFAGYDVDFFVPEGIEVAEHLVLLDLIVGEVGEVFEQEVDIHRW